MVFVDLIMAVGVGVALASVLLAVRVTKQVHSSANDLEVAPVKGIAGGKQPDDDESLYVRVVDIDGPFFFGSTSRLVGQVGAMLGTKIVIFKSPVYRRQL